MPRAPDGLLVVDKPAGWTSHDVVARCRRLCGTKKVGHAGTLDPMATGVLLVGVGRATRLLGHLALSDKAYDATIRFGQTTVTDDAEGDLLTEHDASALSNDAVALEVAALTGVIQQRPSAVSAIKVDGERAYKRVRAGEDVVLPTREVTVSEFEIRAVRRAGPIVEADVHVVCSTGTYVRALARDLGAALGVGGHLSSLRRTRVGSFTLDESQPLEDLPEPPAVLAIDEVARRCFPSYPLTPEQAEDVRSGRALQADLGAAGPVAMFAATEFLALYDQHGPLAKAVAVFVGGRSEE
jgi:tRNA pseudouridine55 synthase